MSSQSLSGEVDKYERPGPLDQTELGNEAKINCASADHSQFCDQSAVVKTLGLEISPTLLSFADEMIQ
jgi:hypothetical protein